MNFNDMWSTVQQAVASGALDPHGRNYHPSFQPGWMPPPALTVPPPQLQDTGDVMPLSAQPSLGGSPFAQPGPLSPNAFPQTAQEPQGFDWSRGLQNAGAWLMANDTGGKSLGALKDQAVQDKDTFDIVNGADGSMYRVSKRKGTVERVGNPTPKMVKIGEGPLGDIMGWQVGDTVYDQNNNVVFGPGSASAPGFSGGTRGVDGGLGLQAVLRPGVRYDDNAMGEDRLAQFKPEIAQVIRDIHAGKIAVPQRGDKYTQWKLQEAALYGQSIGEPLDTNRFAARRKLHTELAGGTAQSTGGQVVGSRTALDHLGEMADSFVSIGNRRAPTGFGWIPKSNDAMEKYNSIANSTSNMAEAKKALDRNVDVYSQEATKMLAGGQPAQAERDRVHNTFKADLTPPAAYGALKKDRDLMVDRFEQNMAKVEAVFGKGDPEAMKQREMFAKTLQKLDKKLDRLKEAAGLAEPAQSPRNNRRPLDSIMNGGDARPPIGTFFN